MTLFVCSRLVAEGRPFPHDVRDRREGFDPLTAEQLRALAAEGNTVGSHTRTHLDCGTRDRDRLVDEIAGSAYRHHLYACGGANTVPGGAPQHLRRVAWPAGLWDLELALQGALESRTTARRATPTADALDAGREAGPAATGCDPA